MPLTQGILPAPINAPRIARDDRGGLDTNALLKMYALIGEEKNRQLQEQKFVTENLYQSHELFKNLKYLPKDADVVAMHLAPVEETLKRGVHNIDQATELQSQLLSALQHPEMRNAMLDYGKMDEYIKRGEVLKEKLGRNAVNYYGKLDEIANTKGSSFEGLNITDYFDDQTQKLQDAAVNANIAHSNAATQESLADTTAKNYALEQTKKNQKYIDDILTDPLVPSIIKMGIANGSVKGNDLIDFGGALESYKNELQKQKEDPTFKPRSLEDHWRAWNNSRYSYNTMTPGSSMTFNYGTGNPIVDKSIKEGMEKTFMVPGAAGSPNKYEGNAVSIYWTNPATKRKELAKEWVESKSSQRAGRVLSVFDNGKVVSINPREDNNPGQRTQDLSTRKTHDIGIPDNQVGDLSNLPGIGDWTEAITLPDGKPLSSNTSIVDKGFLPFDSNNTVIKRPSPDRNLTIQYPGKPPQELYWNVVNETPMGGNDEIGGMSITVGEAVTNNLQIVQQYIANARKQGLSNEEIRKKVSMDYDKPGSDGIPRFRIKDIIFSPPFQGEVLTDDNIKTGQEVYKMYKAKGEFSTNSSTPALNENLKLNSQDPSNIEFVKNTKFRDLNAEQILSLDPQLFSKVKDLSNKYPGILEQAISGAADTKGIRLDSNPDSAHLQGGTALDFTGQNPKAVVAGLRLFNDNYAKSIKKIIFEGPDAASVRKYRKAILESNDQEGALVLDNLKSQGSQIIEEHINPEVLPHLHVEFHKEIPEQKTELDLILQDTSELELPGLPKK